MKKSQSSMHKQLIVIIFLILLFMSVTQIIVPDVWAIPCFIKEQEYEWNKFKEGFPYNDSRITFGLFYVWSLKELAGGSTVEDYENMIERYFIPHNVYWVAGVGSWNVAQTPISEIPFGKGIDNLLTASDKYGVKIVFITPYLNPPPKDTGCPWGKSVVDAYGVGYAEVDDTGDIWLDRPVFDEIDLWKTQMRLDAQRLGELYGTHPSFAGLWVNWEYRSFNAGVYINLGYSNATLSRFVNTNFYRTTVNATGFHTDETKCKLWEMFIDGTTTYNTSTLATDVKTYHLEAHRSYKDDCLNKYYVELIAAFKSYVNPDGLIFHEGGATPQVSNGWSKLAFGYFGDISERVPLSDYEQTLSTNWWRTHLAGFPAPIIAIPGYAPGNNGGGTTVEDYVWILSRVIPTYGVPSIWMMVDPSKFTDGYMDEQKRFGELANRMKFIGRHWGIENPLAKILLVTGNLGPSSWKMLSEYDLSSLGFLVSTTSSDKIVDLNLTQFDAIVWADKNSPSATKSERIIKIRDAVENHSVGFLLIGDGHTIPTDWVEPQADFDGLSTLLKIGYPFGGRWRTNATWNFNLTHPVFSPYSSLSASDFIHDETIGYHFAPTKKPDYDGIDLIVDGNGELVTMARVANQGRVVWFGMYDVDDRLYAKATTVLLNVILWAAKKEQNIPLLWFPEDQGFMDELYFSISGGNGQAFLWFSNRTISENITWNLNAEALNLDITNGWLALSTRTWQVLAKGIGGTISLNFTILPNMWEPIYLLNQTSNLRDLYSNIFIKSRSTATDKATYTLQGPYNQTSWLITNSTKTPTSVTANNTGTLPQHTSLFTLNAITTPNGWYHDSANKILYIKFKTTSTVQIEITEPTEPITPTPTYALNIYSFPISGVSFSVNGTSYTTPLSATLNEGTYTITMPESTILNGTTYNFKNWEDNSTNPLRTINLSDDMSITAYYEQATGPLTTHVLSISSSPITEIPFTINGTEYTTPWSNTLSEGTYIISMPTNVTVGNTTYNFVKWEDQTTIPTRTINLTTDTTITAYYEATVNPTKPSDESDNTDPTIPSSDVTVKSVPEFESVLIATSLGAIAYLVVQRKFKSKKQNIN